MIFFRRLTGVDFFRHLRGVIFFLKIKQKIPWKQRVFFFILMARVIFSPRNFLPPSNDASLTMFEWLGKLVYFKILFDLSYFVCLFRFFFVLVFQRGGVVNGSMLSLLHRCSFPSVELYVDRETRW